MILNIRQKAILALNIIGFLIGPNLQAQHKQLPWAGALETALQHKDTTGLSVYLAPDFALAGHTSQGAQFRLNQVISNYGATAIQVVELSKGPKGTLYQVEFTEKDGKKTVSQALVNHTGQLRYLTQFDQLYGLSRESQSRLVAQIPFENHSGSIILQVRINDFERPLRLLFDTGADGMAVSQKLADELGLQVTRANYASVVGGNKKIEVSEGNTIRLDTLKLTGMGIALFPEMGGNHAEGIIGNILVRRYITEIDYDKNILSLYSFGPHNYVGNGYVVPVAMPSGVMTLPGELEIVASKKFQGEFVFDTGASYDLICFRPFVRQNRLLISGFKPDAQASTVSMGIASPTFLGKSQGFAIKGLKPIVGLPVTLMGGTPTNENWNPGVDGSIGVRLLSRYNMTINLAEGEVFFSPNKLHGLPQDFVLKDYQFGWNNQGELVVLDAIGIDEAEAKLKKGTMVDAIGGVASDKLIKKAGFIEELQKRVKVEEEITVRLLDGLEVAL